jgi:hypothetical protein
MRRDRPHRRAAGPGPFSLADPERIRALLTEAGCTDIKIEPLHERLRLGADVPDVLTCFRDHPAASSSITAMDDATLGKVGGELAEAKSETPPALGMIYP